MESGGFVRVIIAPKGDNATLKNLNEFKKYEQYKTQGVFQVSLQTVRGTIRSSVTGLNPTVTKIYGSNITAEGGVGVEDISRTSATNDIPLGITSLTQGLVKDETHSGHERAGKRLPKGVYIAISENHGFPVYYTFPYCTSTPGLDINMQINAAGLVTARDSFTVIPQTHPTDNLLCQIFVGDTSTGPAWRDGESVLEYIISGLRKADSSH